VADQCSICQHPQRDEIEAAILRGDTYRHIASQFDVGYRSVARHKNNGHMRTQLIEKEVPTVERVHTVNPWNEVEYWHEEIKTIYAQAKSAGEHSIALNAVDKALKSLAAVLQIRKAGEEERVDIDPVALAKEIMDYLKGNHPEAYRGLLNHLERQYDAVRN